MAHSIVQRYDQNILRSITPTGTAPVAGYTLATFLALNPGARILWGATSITLTWTLAGAATGDILVIPVTNLEGNVLTLENGAGLSVPVPIPTMTANRIPKTIVLDFSSSANRNSSTWTLTISGNVSNVVFGGVVAIYAPKTELLFSDFMFGGILDTTAAVMEIKNSYLTRYRQILRTQERSITVSRVMSQTEEAKFDEWYRANWGSGYPSLLWPHPPENDAFFGTWPPTYSRTQIERNPVSGRIYQVQLRFDELSKGQPV